MSTSSKLILEILDSTNQWVDRTADLVHGQIHIGRPYLGFTSDIGQAQFTLNNKAQTYNSTANLDEGYRVRVKASGARLGNCLQVQHSGANGNDQSGFQSTVALGSWVLNDVFTVTWDARAQYDSQYNLDRVLLEGTNIVGGLSPVTYTNKWQTYSFTVTATGAGSSGDVRFDAAYSPVGATNNTRMIEYRNIKVQKNGGANLLSNGNFSNGFTGWTTYSAVSPASSITTNVTNDYWIIFNGVIETISPAPFANAGTFQVQVTASDLMRWMKQKVDLPLQKNRTADQLNTTLLSQINNGSYSKAVLLDVPMAYYRLDETSGSTAQDLSGNALNGTYVGSVTLNTAGPLYGDTDTAATFDGSTGYVSIPIPDLVGKPFSFEVWFKPLALPGVGLVTMIVGVAQPGVSEAGIYLNNSAGTTFVSINLHPALDATTPQTAVAGTWYHAVYTYNAVTQAASLYINGALIVTYTGIASLIGVPSAAYIGREPYGGGDWFNGVIDEVAIYNFPLTAAQVSRHYNAGLGTYNTVKLPGKQQTTGLQSFPVAFDRYDKQSVTILNALREVANSEYGIQWLDRDGTFRFGARDYLPKLIVTAPKLTLSDGMPFKMGLSRSSAQLTNHVTMTYHPRNTVSATVVLGQITSPIAIPGTGGGNLGVSGNAAAGAPTSQTITLTFVDSVGNKVGGDSVISPVATTDYLVNDKQDGSGHDYTTDSAFAIGPVVISASQATITLTNKAAGTLYATKLQIRGNAVYTYNPVTLSVYNAQSIIAQEDRPYSTDLAFSADANFTNSLALYLLSRFGMSYLEAQNVSADYKTQLNGVDLLSIELMDMITITDAQTGLNNIKHLVDSITYTFDYRAADGLQSITFGLSRLDQQAYWILNDATYGVLGTTTTLYI